MPLPETLGRLRRVRLLGSGGFATVWLYQDPDLDSPVAVKALAENWAGVPDIRDRFLQEARLLRRADSPHVVHVYDVGETDDGVPYFVMTYADGGTVGDLLKTSHGVEPAQLVDVIGQAAAGLSALHDHGIVHRDIKPANLLLATDVRGRRRVMVADLGVAKSLATDSGVTSHVGTPAYMAPEQLDSTTPLDARADVRALGGVAYALIAGRDPRPPRWPLEPIERVSALRAVPPQVDAVVMRAMEPDRAYRWPDTPSFADALAHACAGVRFPPPVPMPAQTRVHGSGAVSPPPMSPPPGSGASGVPSGAQSPGPVSPGPFSPAPQTPGPYGPVVPASQEAPRSLLPWVLLSAAMVVIAISLVTVAWFTTR